MRGGGGEGGGGEVVDGPADDDVGVGEVEFVGGVVKMVGF